MVKTLLILVIVWVAAAVIYRKFLHPYLIKPMAVLHGNGKRRWPFVMIVAILLIFVNGRQQQADAFTFGALDLILSPLFNTLADVDFFESAKAAILAAFKDLICILLDAFGPVVLKMFELIPDSVAEFSGEIVGYLNIADKWVPIKEGLVILAVYLGFLLIQLPTKLAVKLFVPTVG